MLKTGAAILSTHSLNSNKKIYSGHIYKHSTILNFLKAYIIIHINLSQPPGTFC